MVTTPATTSVTVTDEVTVADDGAAAPVDVVAPQPVADDSERRDWYRAVAIGMAAFVVSRLCVLAGAGVRASQLVVDATNDGEPRPGTPLGPDRRTSSPSGTGSGTWRSSAAATRGRSRRTSRTSSGRRGPPSSPCIPILARAADRILPGGDTFAALFVNLVLAVIAVVLVGLLARRLFGVQVAERAMVLFAVFPGSFVLSYAYAEALLIVLAAACLLFLVDERWLLAGVAAGLATATRPNGIALVAACAVAAGIAIYRRRDWLSLIAPLLAPVGFISFQLFLAGHTGESWPWFRVQREAWREGTSFGATAISNTLSFVTHPLQSPTDALTAASLFALLGGLWCLWKRPLPWPMIAYVAVVIALMLLPATVTARPRFLYTAFPLIICAAAWWPRRDRVGWDLMMVACGAGLTALTTLYAVFGAIP